MVPADSYRIPRVPHYLGYSPDASVFDYAAFTLYGRPFQTVRLDLVTFVAVPLPRPGLNTGGLGYAPFARRYWGYHFCFLFLQVLGCFGSLRSPRQLVPVSLLMGCPIRTPADQRLLAPPRGVSPLAASFLASWSLGIHRPPLLSFPFSARHC